MMLFRCAVALTLFAVASADQVTPVAKVIDLLEGLKKEVEDEGSAEAASYDKFACFCKDETIKKSNSVKKGKDDIDITSAEIADKTQSKKDDATELGERKSNQEKLSAELDETVTRCAKDKATYEADAADHAKAISSLKSATKAMKDSRPSAASLLAVSHSVVKALMPLSKSASIRKRLVMLQQQQGVDPNNPEYEFHSNDIIGICEMLLEDFKKGKSELDKEWEKTDKACVATKKSLKAEMTANKDAMAQLEKDIETLAKEIAEAREKLVSAQDTLKDDKLYLKDMTAMCETRAKDYDQRSEMRGAELEAMNNALSILTKDVKGADEEANDRALLLQGPSSKSQDDDDDASDELKQLALNAAPVSFLQGASVRQHSQNFLAHAGRGGTALETELEAKKTRALAMLREEGRKMGSMTIASLTVKVAKDPFKKVKYLIQQLIERLLDESRMEATKKGFCDESLGKAEHDRDSRFMETRDLNRALASLEAKEDELTEEIDHLTKSISDAEDLLKKTTEDREEEKADNIKTLKTAKQGYASVTEALALLKQFYSSAARASASLVQASPVDEDTSGPGFEGSYKGAQGGMKAVFALLETIQSDFDRTIRKTEEAEGSAHRDHVSFVQATKSQIASESTKKELDEQDLKSTKTNIKAKFADMQANMDLLDDALQELEALKPTCIDTGMSFKDRVAKREDEMAALKKALCILDTDKKEAECA